MATAPAVHDRRARDVGAVPDVLVIYHLNVGSVPFRRTGWIRTVYFAVLIPHVILAAAIVPLVLMTVSRALSKRFDRHRVIARWTLPLWMYVSITGVIVY